MRQIKLPMKSLRNQGSAILYLASAFALPPKIIQLDWSLAKRKELKIPERRASKVELLTRQYVDPPVDVFPAKNLAKKSESSQSTVELPKRFEFREGIFQLNTNTLAFISREQKNINLWSIPLGFEAMKMEKTGARTGLVAWDIYPSQIFFLDWGEKASGAKALGYKINWSEDSEVIRFFECHFGKWVLVENLPNGMTRFYFIERETDGLIALKGYTVFDLNPKSNASEVLNVQNDGCRNFYLSGTFGRVQVRY